MWCGRNHSPYTGARLLGVLQDMTASEASLPGNQRISHSARPGVRAKSSCCHPTVLLDDQAFLPCFVTFPAALLLELRYRVSTNVLP